MGIPSSKHSSNEAIDLCRERTQYIKQAIDSRYALSAAHLAYLQSLRSTGIALRRFVEAEMSTEPSISTSEHDRSPSRSSYASSSPGRTTTTQLPYSPPRLLNMNYMRASGSSSMAVTVNHPTVHFVKEEEEEEVTSSPWDFFDTTHDKDRLSEMVPLVEENSEDSCLSEGEKKLGVDKSLEALIGIASRELGRSNTGKFDMDKEEVFAEREDASEFITHRAKDFLSSMKDVEHRFLRAAESGKEVSKLLETSKIRLGIARGTVKLSSCRFLSTFQEVCCNTEAIFKQELGEKSANVITWNRSVSSLSSSSSKKYLETAAKDCDEESDFEFIEECCMISGSHSSTLDRLYAWEIKLYDEVKASDSLRKAYDNKCSQLRHQFARNLNSQVTDRTRAVVKDLHSQIMVSFQAVDSISKRIEKMRDEELQPQLMELLKGLIKMWKAMLECHHQQFITISLAYHVMSSTPTRSGSFNQALFHLQVEINCFSLTTASLVKSHELYIKSLNSWIHKCILPQEPPKGKRRKASFPRCCSLSLPPIFVLCQHWLNGIASLSFEELDVSLKDMVSILNDFINQEKEVRTDDDIIVADNEEEKFYGNWNFFDGLKTSLIRVFDQLAKFSEASSKVFEGVRQENETACLAYSTS